MRTATLVPSYPEFLPALVPRILLIDSDRRFVAEFRQAARESRLAVDAFASVVFLDSQRNWTYDLVILDLTTVDKAFVKEICRDIRMAHRDVPILFIAGTNANGIPGIARRAGTGFSNKAMGADAVLFDALRLYSVESKAELMEEFA